MKATETSLLAFLNKAPQFVIPIYQRTYSWTEKECEQLWKDLLRAGNDDAIGVHFIGSIVYIEESLGQVSHRAPLLVIDGQQRLTTVSLVLAALAAALGDTEPVRDFSASKVRNWYLLNPEDKNEQHYKLILSQTDKATLTSIVGRLELPTEKSLRVSENYELFTTLLAKCNGDFTALCKGLAKLVVVDIALSRDQDNPQLIFESMNSTGRELSQADLIRNFVLMGLAPELQTHMYKEYWRPMELGFGQEAYVSYFDSFMRHYLTVKTGEIPKIGDVYEAFKKYAQTPAIAAAGVEALVREMRSYSRYFCALALGVESHAELKLAFQDLRDLKVDVTYPFLLEVYGDYKDDRIGADDFVAVVRLVEGYVFRRSISSIPANSMNKTFGNFGKNLNKDRYLESVKANFQLLPSYRRFPTDGEFERDIQTRDIYKFRSRGYWLRRLENFERKERVPVSEYTIEHILPQNENLNEAWRKALGPEWQGVQERWLHTLGNLTLTGYNSEYSDRAFEDKRDMKGGFKDSPLKLNKGLGQVETWNEDAIRSRAERLAKLALKVWPAPGLSTEAVEQYRPVTKQSQQTTYTLDRHHKLATGLMRPLYEALRTEVLALDPCISEEIRKPYIAFKAENNFASVRGRREYISISLQITIDQVVDPRGLCKDVSTSERWRNVEVRMKSMEDLPSTMGIIRQALEQQMDDDSE